MHTRCTHAPDACKSVSMMCAQSYVPSSICHSHNCAHSELASDWGIYSPPSLQLCVANMLMCVVYAGGPHLPVHACSGGTACGRRRALPTSTNLTPSFPATPTLTALAAPASKTAKTARRTGRRSAAARAVTRRIATVTSRRARLHTCRRASPHPRRRQPPFKVTSTAKAQLWTWSRRSRQRPCRLTVRSARDMPCSDSEQAHPAFPAQIAKLNAAVPGPEIISGAL